MKTNFDNNTIPFNEPFGISESEFDILNAFIDLYACEEKFVII